MQRTMLKSKIHRATVTDANLHYVGSVTVDEDLMRAADLLPGEQVAIVDVTNGARLETYVITGQAGSGVIGINGAAAHLVSPGDLVILISYGVMDDAEARTYQPRVVFVDGQNRVLDRGADPAHVPAAAETTSLLRPGTEAQPAQPTRPPRHREPAAGPAMTTVGGWGADLPAPAGRERHREPAGQEPAAHREPTAAPRRRRDGSETTDARRLDALLSSEN